MTANNNNNSNDNDDDDGFQSFQSSSSKKNRNKNKNNNNNKQQRIYIGNLPPQATQEELKQYIEQQHQQQQQEGTSNHASVVEHIEIHSVVSNHDNHQNTKKYAFVTLSPGIAMDPVIQSLQKQPELFQGFKLSIQRERKNNNNNNNYKKNPKKSNNTFSKGWSKPTTMNTTEQQLLLPPATTTKEASERIAMIVSEEMDKNNPDKINAALVSMAAVSVAASTQFGIHNDNDIDSDNDGNEPQQQQEEEEFDFFARQKQSLADMMASELGEYDPNWNKVHVDEQEQEIPQQKPEPEEQKQQQQEQELAVFENRLLRHGKAPIHIELVSFGYHHGAPARSGGGGGFAHSQPLPPFDCRHLPQVPPYLAWMDGLTGAVKHALLRAYNDEDGIDKTNNNVKKYAQNTIAPTVANALEDAMTVGGYGYAMPLKMTIHVGSQLGKHRSVVVCEIAATAIRQLLRSNTNNRFPQPCSVGCRHSELGERGDYQSKSSSSTSSSHPKKPFVKNTNRQLDETV